MKYLFNVSKNEFAQMTNIHESIRTNNVSIKTLKFASGK